MAFTQATFQTNLQPNFTPTDRFRPGLEWKRQGEQADLLKVFPEEFHKAFGDDFLHPIVSFALPLSAQLI
jgi:hypothetical protein